MRNLIDLTGRKFGRLTVIKRVYPNRGEHPYWLCKCECGTEKIIRGNDLKTGRTKSCGCLKREIAKSGNARRLSSGLATMRMRIAEYKRSAKRRKLKWGLTEEQFKKLTQQDCYYCGAKPNNIIKSKRLNGAFIYNGLDRVDNTKGYTIDNVVPCCEVCNIAKHNLTLQEYQDWIVRSYNKMKETKRVMF